MTSIEDRSSIRCRKQDERKVHSAETSMKPNPRAVQGEAGTHADVRPGKEGTPQATTATFSLPRDVSSRAVKDELALRLSLWLRTTDDLIFYRLSMFTLPSNAPTASSCSVTRASSRLASSLCDGANESEPATDITAVSAAEPGLESKHCKAQDVEAPAPQAASASDHEVDKDPLGRKCGSRPSQEIHPEELVSLLRRADSLILRLRRWASGEPLEDTVDDIVSDFRSLCIDRRPLQSTLAPSGGQSSQGLSFQPDLNDGYDQGGPSNRALGNRGKRPIRGSGTQQQDTPIVTVQGQPKGKQGKYLRCLYYSVADTAGNFCDMLHKYPSNLGRHLRAHRFYLCTECFLHFELEFDLDNHFHQDTCICLDCYHRPDTNDAHPKVPGCPNPRQMTTEQKWKSWFVLAHGNEERIPDLDEFYIDPSEANALVREPSQVAISSTSAAQAMPVSALEPSVGFGNDIDAFLMGLGAVAGADSFIALPSNTGPAPTGDSAQIIQDLQNQVMQLNRGMFHVMQELQAIRSEAALRLGGTPVGFVNPSNIQLPDNRASAEASGSTAFLLHPSYFNSAQAIENAYGQPNAIAQADDSTRSQGGSRRHKPPRHPVPRDSGYGGSQSG